MIVMNMNENGEEVPSNVNTEHAELGEKYSIMVRENERNIRRLQEAEATLQMLHCHFEMFTDNNLHVKDSHGIIEKQREMLAEMKELYAKHTNGKGNVGAYKKYHSVIGTKATLCFRTIDENKRMREKIKELEGRLKQHYAYGPVCPPPQPSPSLEGIAKLETRLDHTEHDLKVALGKIASFEEVQKQNRIMVETFQHDQVLLTGRIQSIEANWNSVTDRFSKSYGVYQLMEFLKHFPQYMQQIQNQQAHALHPQPAQKTTIQHTGIVPPPQYACTVTQHPPAIPQTIQAIPTSTAAACRKRRQSQPPALPPQPQQRPPLPETPPARIPVIPGPSTSFRAPITMAMNPLAAIPSSWPPTWTGDLIATMAQPLQAAIPHAQ
ncbi:hypothetical protein QR680_017927 [Steinernema hermaphroditum]|uniref:Uncharacterized protein n=1 Tax=Steinernema hermaphroditum TaxID=289476 RepID=A0AA39HH17_9BILA|nr:hypothetical protein QR680_017927 [Steinernema hermaphroditum]